MPSLLGGKLGPFELLPTHCTNMPSFPAAVCGSRDVQLWIQARFVQEGWREGHLAPEGASDQAAKPKAVQICG
jgi:hypothetical protein